jgi:AcrR family transcriptional regulator
MTNPAAVKPLRSDAVRTRKLLVKAASEAFAEHGSAVSVSQIAARAGIGKGTVFRHFATKEDLLAAIVYENMFLLVATGERLTQVEDPANGLLQFMSAAVELQVNDRSFCQVAHGEARDHPEVRKGQQMIDAVTEALTDRARRHGAIRFSASGKAGQLSPWARWQGVSVTLAARGRRSPIAGPAAVPCSHRGVRQLRHLR